MEVEFRPALPTDAREIARLFRISSEGASDYIWSQLAEPGQDLLEVGAARYARENVDFSYQNCLVAQADGRVIGMMHRYVTREDPLAAPVMEPVLAPYADIDFNSGSWDGGIYSYSLTGNGEGHLAPLRSFTICADGIDT